MNSEERMSEMGFTPSDLEMLVGMSQDVYGPDEFSEAVQFHLNHLQPIGGKMSQSPANENKTPRQIADELVAEGLVKWAPSRPGHGMEIVGTSVPEAEPKMTIEEFREKYKSQDLTKPGRCLGITSSYPGRGYPPPKRKPE